MSYQRYQLTARRRFFRDAIVYTLFGIVLMQLSMLFFPRYWYLPFIGWSIGLVMQYINVFVRDFERDLFIENEIISRDREEEAAKQQERLDLYDLSRMPEEAFRDEDMI